MDFRCLTITDEALAFLTELEKKDMPNFESYVILFKHTPDALRLAGLKDLPIIIPKRKATMGINIGKGEVHGHRGEYSSTRLMKTLVQLGNPVTVLKNEDAVGVYVETLDNVGKPMFICIKPREDANVVTSVYGDRRLKRDRDTIVYIDDTRLPNIWKGGHSDTKVLRNRLIDIAYRGKAMLRSGISRKDLRELI